MMLYVALGLMILAPIHIVFAAVRVWNHSDIFTTLAAATIKLAPVYFFIGVGMLIVYGTQWFDHHAISVTVK